MTESSWQKTEKQTQIKLVSICSSAEHCCLILDNPNHRISGLPIIAYPVSNIEYRMTSSQQPASLTPEH